jgi:hypothetical protein
MSREMQERRRCTAPDVIPKSTFLTMVGPPLGVGGTSTPTRAYFESLLDEQWSITSFNSNTRDVCIEVESPYGVRTMTITLPYLSNSKP